MGKPPLIHLKFMKSITIFLIQSPKTRKNLVRAAARQVFPEAQFIVAHKVTDAARHIVHTRRQLLILINQNETEISAAAQATDQDGLPRWAVVNLGRHRSELVESIPLEKCVSFLFGRVLHSAVLQYELLRENLRLRGDLMTIARRYSHDLMSPLNCISITCELLKEVPHDRDSTEAQIALIRNSLAEACRTIERVSYVLKASANPVPAMVVSMDGVVDSVLQQLDGKLQRENVTVRRPMNWPAVKGVAAWLEVVWWNLITNALKYRLSSTPVQLGWSNHDDTIRFWASNQGPAVAASQETQLFSQFDQLHALPAPGLGLSLAQRLVSLQNGSCGYERLAGDLSRFYFTLPPAG
jgi:signal transduction histidine kinase